MCENLEDNININYEVNENITKKIFNENTLQHYNILDNIINNVEEGIIIEID